MVTHVTDRRVLTDAFLAAYEGPAGTEPPQFTAWHNALFDAGRPLLAAAQNAGTARRDLDIAELLALVTGVARVGSPGQAERFLSVLLDGITPRLPYRDGLGLEVMQDRQVEGDWPGLLDAPGRSLRAVFLGDPRVPDDHSGVLELNLFDGDVAQGPPASPRKSGFLLLSFFVDVEAALGRLAGLGLGGSPRLVTQPAPNGQVTIATVRDPDGVLVLLTPGSITRRACAGRRGC